LIAEQLDPEDDVCLQFLAAVAGSRWRTRNLARATLDRLQAIAPESATAALLRAGVELRSFRPLRAFRAAAQSVALDPSNPQSRALHAIFVSLVKRRHGGELMHQAMTLDPGDAVLRDLAIGTGLNYWRPSLIPLFVISCLVPPMLIGFVFVAAWELLLGRRRRIKKLSPDLQHFLRQAVRIKRPYRLWRWVLMLTTPPLALWTLAVVQWLRGGRVHSDWHLDSAPRIALFAALWALVALAVWRRTVWWRTRAPLLGLGDRKWTEGFSLKVLYWIVVVILILWTLPLVCSVTTRIEVDPLYLFGSNPLKPVIYLGLWVAVWWIRKRRRLRSWSNAPR
jgi:hypothetical protein